MVGSLITHKQVKLVVPVCVFMEFPPEHMMLFPDTNSFGYDLGSSDSPYGSMPLASSCHNPSPIPPPPPPSLLDSLLQSHRVRMELAQESRRKAAVLRRILGGNAGGWMREREVKLEWARKRNRELEARLIKTELASRRLQQVAMEKEAELSSALERAGGGDDAESSTTAQEEGNMVVCCRVCRRQRPSVVVLPCRHLCSCQPCEPALASCPVCQTRKNGSISVRFL